jgi:hypothetical protein
MLINISRALAPVVAICNTHVIFHRKLHRNIRVIYKENMTYFQFKKHFDRSASMGVLDDLILNLIVLYVPALTPRFH